MGDGNREVNQGEQDVRQDVSQGLNDVENAPENAAKDVGDAVSLGCGITSRPRVRLIEIHRSAMWTAVLGTLGGMSQTSTRVSRTPMTKASSRGTTTKHISVVQKLDQLYCSIVFTSSTSCPRIIQDHIIGNS
jgi:hypothetical protein